MLAQTVDFVIPSKMHFKDVLHVLKNINENFREDSETSSPITITFYANAYGQLDSAIRVAKSMGMNVIINSTLDHSIDYFISLKDVGVSELVIKLNTDCKDLAKLEELARILPTTINVQHSFQTSFLDFIKMLQKSSIKDVLIDSKDFTRLKNITRVSGAILTRFPKLEAQVAEIDRIYGLFGLKHSVCKSCNFMRNHLTIVELEVYPCMEYYRNKGNKIGHYFGENTAKHVETWANETNVLDNLICKTGCNYFTKTFNEGF